MHVLRISEATHDPYIYEFMPAETLEYRWSSLIASNQA